MPSKPNCQDDLLSMDVAYYISLSGHHVWSMTSDSIPCPFITFSHQLGNCCLWPEFIRSGFCYFSLGQRALFIVIYLDLYCWITCWITWMMNDLHAERFCLFVFIMFFIKKGFCHVVCFFTCIFFLWESNQAYQVILTHLCKEGWTIEWCLILKRASRSQ